MVILLVAGNTICVEVMCYDINKNVIQESKKYPLF